MRTIYNKNSDFFDLLTISLLPLISGSFVTVILSGLLEGSRWNAVTAGLTIISGSLTFLTALRLTGNVYQRTAKVLIIYGITGPIAIVESLFAPSLEFFFVPTINVFTGLFLLGHGLAIIGEQRLSNLVDWSGVKQALKIALIASAIAFTMSGVSPDLTMSSEALAGTAIALAAGLGLTCLGAVTGLLLGDGVNLRSFRLGAAGTLVLVALVVMGVGIPSILAFAPLFSGLMITLWMALVHKRRANIILDQEVSQIKI